MVTANKFGKGVLSFLFVNKTVRLNNLKTRTAVNAKILVLAFCVEGSYICYYIICMIEPSILSFSETDKQEFQSNGFLM